MLHALGDMVQMAYYITKITLKNEGEVILSSEFEYNFFLVDETFEMRSLRYRW